MLPSNSILVSLTENIDEYESIYYGTIIKDIEITRMYYKVYNNWL